MKHRHTYRTLSWWTLTLPDVTGWYEGILTWECVTCGDVVWATGHFAPNCRAMSPDEWQQIAARERRTLTALGTAAAQQEQHHVLATDRYDTFTRRR